MKSKINQFCLALGVMSVSAFAFADAPDVSTTAAALTALIAPIGVIGGARMGVNVAIRGWKIVARMI